MQNAGSLRKRRARNISKVGGLGVKSLSNDRPYSRVTRDPKFSREQSHIVIKVEPCNANNTNEDASINYQAEPEWPYVIRKLMMKELRLIILVCRCSFLVPWQWENNTDKGIRIETYSYIGRKIWMILSSLVLICSSMLTLFQFNLLVGAIHLADKTGSYVVAFQCGQGIAWHLHAAMFNIFFLVWEERIRNYINMLFQFNQNFARRYGVTQCTLEGEGGSPYIYITVPMCLSQILVSLWRYLSLHDAPFYLTAQISEYLPSEKWKPLLLMVSGVQDVLTGAHLVGGVTILGWIIVAHSVTIAFWLKESHHMYDSDQTSASIRNQRNSQLVYRSCQVLSHTFNRVIGKVLMPFSAFITATASFVCGYVAIRFMNWTFIEEFPSSILYPFGIFNTMCSAYAQFQMAAVMYDLGASYLDSWANEEQEEGGNNSAKDIEARKFLISCSLVRVHTIGTRQDLVGYFNGVTDKIIDSVISFP